MELGDTTKYEIVNFDPDNPKNKENVKHLFFYITREDIEYFTIKYHLVRESKTKEAGLENLFQFMTNIGEDKVFEDQIFEGASLDEVLQQFHKTLTIKIGDFDYREVV